MPVITLTTDFGLADPYVGVMKGVILGITPDVSLVDLCHEISPQNLEEASWVIGSNYSYFPKNTVHLVVVDPGVGSSRRALVIRAGEQYFVGPDNGIFTDLLRKEFDHEIYELTNKDYFLPKVSQTFHGRDIFAPVAAALAKGVPLLDLGRVIEDPVQLPSNEPEEIQGGFRLHVIRSDRFGNLITNAKEQRFEEWVLRNPDKKIVLDVGRRHIDGIAESYSQVPEGALLMIFGSSGNLEIAINGGSAEKELNLSKDTSIILSALRKSWV